MEEKKKSKAASPSPTLSQIEQWERDGIPCRYVRFHQPIPRFVNDEPVSEFQINHNGKYGVESISYGEHGVIWRLRGEINVCALANVMYARSVLK
jgi:hypothetical protein